MSPRQIEAFRAIIMTGSVTGAADMLCVSQPAISRLIKDLEDELGFQLFERLKGRVFPTGMALSFYREVERSFIGLDRLAAAAQQIRDNRAGQLRINTLPTMANSVLPQSLGRFVANYPDVSINMEVFNSETVLQHVAARQCDIGFTATEIESTGVQPGPQLRAFGVCIMPPGHPLTEKSEISPEDLTDVDFVSLGTNTLLRYKIDAAFNTRKVRRQLPVEASLTSAVVELVRCGLGVSIVDSFFAAKPGIEARPFTVAIPFDYQAIMPLNQPNPVLTQAFLDTLIASLPPDIQVL